MPKHIICFYCFISCFIPFLHIRSLYYYYSFFFRLPLHSFFLESSLKSMANHLITLMHLCSISVYSTVISFCYSPWHNLQRNYIHLSTFSDPVLLLFTGPGGKRTFIVFTQRTMDMDIPPRITRRFFTISSNHITYSYLYY